MPEIVLRGNSPLFSADLRQLGHVFFPGEEIAVAVPGEPQVQGDIWHVDVSASAMDGEGANWTVTVAARGPEGRRVLEGAVQRGAAESPRQFDHRVRRLAKGLLVDALGELRGFRPGWGILTGVRPTKLVHQMLDAGVADPEQELIREHRLAPEKAALVTGVARLQRPYLNQDPRAISLYIGIPFCPSICSFCSFSIYPILEHRSQVPAFLEALGREMEIIGDAIAELGLRVQSIYFGGGTPTSPRDEDFAWMLEKASQTILRGQQPAEYTVEGGRPETFTRPKLDAMAAHGVNRVSVNPQTTVQATLLHLGRIHTVEKFYRAYDLVRTHPHPFVVNSDIIIGLPGEGPAEVAYTLADMKRLAPDNLTVHTLAIKRGSKLHQAEGEAAEALRALTYLEAEQLIRDAAGTAREMGQHPYYLYRQKFMVGSMENVGYSLPGKESIYNIQMMEERQTVIGLGGGATSKWYKPLGGYHGWLLKAPDNPNDPASYIARVEENARRRVEQLRLIYEPAHILARDE
ncbi:MAG TPA: coproporphyrinogen dehydrogenase HemZ [Symbiobacteriaceae bacterium]|nr:coproporphyrinogen dehydrogenase HemZ [Symbiobacteriaceae bacterium]